MSAPFNEPAQPRRIGRVVRTTNETRIEVAIDLDGSDPHDGSASAVVPPIETPLPFLSHMLEQLGKHGGFTLSVRATGDVHIDGHHTTEDIGIVLGQAFAAALGEKRGISRYGWATLVMDEARVSVALDLSGRTYFVFDADIPKAKLGTFDSELAEVFFEAFARGAACNLHIVKEAGRNLHHILEITFKAFAKSLAQASRVTGKNDVPSTKGSL